MKDLVALVQLVSEQDSHDLTGKYLSANHNELVCRLYYGVLSNAYEDESDAISDLFPKNFHQSYFSKIKSDLRDAIIVSWFSLSNTTSDYGEKSIAKATEFCDKALCAMWSMARTGRGTLAMRTLKKVLSLATKYQLTRQRMEANQLLSLLSTSSGDVKLVQKYSGQAVELARVYALEVEASSIVQQLYAGAFGKANAPSKLEKQQDLVEALLRIRQSGDSFQLRRDTYRGLNFIAQAEQDFKQSIQLTSEMQDFYTEYPHLTSNARSAELHIQLSGAYFNIGRFDMGKEEALHAVNLRPVGSRNWVIANQQLFINMTHLGEFSQASKLVTHVMNTDGFLELPDTITERWYIFDTVLKALMHDHFDFENSHFEVDFNNARKDRTGYNVLLIAIETIRSIFNGELSELIKKKDAIERYNSRYLLEADKRANLFLKCVLLTIREEFDYTRVSILSEQYLSKMSKRYPTNVNQTECIPYGKLWEVVLRALKVSQNPAIRSLNSKNHGTRDCDNNIL